MGLLSFLKRKSGEAPKKASAMPPEPVDTVQQARTRARQRLVGAVVLNMTLAVNHKPGRYIAQ